MVGTGAAGFNGDGRAASETDLYRPIAPLFGEDGRLWLLDWNNHRLRVVEDGVVTTAVGSLLPGDGPQDGREEGAGAPGPDVPLNHPTDLAWRGGELVMAAWHNHKIRSFDPATGLVRILAGADPGFLGDGGLAADALLQYPAALDVDETGAIWVIDNENGRLRRIADGTIETVAGTGEVGFNGDDRAPLETELGLPPGSGLGFEPGGGVLVGDDGIWLAESLTHRIRRFDTNAGTFTTVAGTGVEDHAGDGAALDVPLAFPHDLEWGPDGALWFTDSHNNLVRRLLEGRVETMVGIPGDGGSVGISERASAEEIGDGGLARDATLAGPAGIAFDAAGDLYIADRDHHRIRRVVRDW